MKRPSKPKAATKPRARPQDPARTIEQALPEIVDALIAEAKQGSYQHARFLFEFAGLGGFPRPPAEEEESLAALLLRELQVEKS